MDSGRMMEDSVWEERERTVESKRIIRTSSASIAVPVQFWRADLSVTVGDELRDGNVEHIAICDLLEGSLTFDKLCRCRNRKRSKAQEGSDDGGLHLGWTVRSVPE